MNRWSEWAASRRWSWELEPTPLEYRLDTEVGVQMCVTRPAYAECQGPDDPVCGRARFSLHGCNGDGPSREQFLDDRRARRLV